MRFLPFLSLVLLVGCPSGLEEDTDDTDTESARSEVLGLGVAPNDPILELGESVDLQVKVYYEDSSWEVVTEDASFEVTNTRVISLSGSTVQAQEEGESDIIVTWGDEGVSSKVKVTVKGEDVTIVDYTLQPTAVDLVVGDTVQMTVIAEYSDGTEGNASGGCTWDTEDDAVVTIDERGGVEAVGEGTTRVHAFCGTTDLESRVTVEAEGTDVGLPDLVLTDLSALVVGDEVLYEAEVTNQGDAVAGGFYVDGFLDASSAPSEGDGSYDTTAWVSGLAPGETATISMDIVGLSPGTYQSYAYADTDGWVDEEDESNNVDGPVEVRIEEQTLGPNLIIARMDGLTDGSYTYYEIEIENTGDEPAVDFYVDLWWDIIDFPDVCDYGDDYLYIEELGPNEYILWEPDVETGPSTTWDSYVWADSCDAVEEQDEDDNEELLELTP